MIHIAILGRVFAMFRRLHPFQMAQMILYSTIYILNFGPRRYRPSTMSAFSVAYGVWAWAFYLLATLDLASGQTVGTPSAQYIWDSV